VKTATVVGLPMQDTGPNRSGLSAALTQPGRSAAAEPHETRFDRFS
jgi:hypothetical protein